MNCNQVKPRRLGWMPLASLSLGAFAGCASVAPVAPQEPAPRAERSEREAPRAVSGSIVLAPQRQNGFSGAELSIFGDPSFQKAFAESYLSETEIEPRVTTLEYERMQDVLALMAEDQSEEAIALLEKRNGPNASATFDFTLGNLHFQREEYDEAVQAYGTAIAKHPKFRRAWKNLALLHMRREHFDRATEAFTKVIEFGGADALTWGLLGVTYSNSGDDVAAESAYRMAALLDPASADWKRGLALSLFKQGRFDSAASLLDSMLAGEPERADLWLLQANAYIGLGQPLRAAENYELVDQLGGSTGESLSNLGDIYVNEGLFGLAVGAYLRALAAEPEGEATRALRAAKALTANGARTETRELVDGIEALRGERLSADDRKDVLKLRARLAVAEGAADEEAQLLEEIIALDPLDGDALILLGQYNARQGDPERAVFYYEQAEALEAFEADAKVRHAQLLVGQGRASEALPLLRRAQSLEPREHVQAYLEQVERLAKGR